MLADGAGQGRQFGEFVVEGADQFAAAVFPAEQDGRGLATPGGIAQGDGLVHAFYMYFIFGYAQVRPGLQAQCLEFGGVAFFNEDVAIGRRGRIEP